MRNQEVTKKIRTISKRLLSTGKVDYILGFEKGTVPMKERPVIISDIDDIDKLIWNRFCSLNLANFLLDFDKESNIAVVAQGCVSRSIVGLMKENQISREQLYIIGVPSLGMIDTRRIHDLLGFNKDVEIVEEISDQELLIKGKDFEETISCKNILRSNCYTCIEPKPVIFDEIVEVNENFVRAGNIDNIAGIWERFSSEKRWSAFVDNYESCVRCYACRDACPLCYCNECFVDESQPQWCGKTQDETDVLTYHFLRAFHCAGRCTDCGACESVCPMGIDVRRLTSKIEKDIRELYGYQAGIDLEAKPPMNVYCPDDIQNFIK